MNSLSLDHAEFGAAAGEARALLQGNLDITKLPVKLRKLLLRFRDVPAEFFVIKNVTAEGTLDSHRLEPMDGFRDLLSALRALVGDGLVVK